MLPYLNKKCLNIHIQPCRKAWLLYFCKDIKSNSKHIVLSRFVIFICFLVSFLTTKAQIVADFQADQIEGCPPFLVQFSDLSTGSPATYFWDLGNGTTSTQQNPGIIYFNPGSYTVKLIIKKGALIDSIVKNQYIVVNALPVPAFTVSDTTGCYPLTVKFNDGSLAGSGQINSWQWDFGDGNISSDQSPVHTYTSQGSYTVLLNVSNSHGCSKVISKPNFISIQNGVVAAFNYTSNQGCQTSALVSFFNQSTGTGTLQYLWDFGNGFTSTLQNPTTNYNTSGSFSVKLVVSNNFGCKDSSTKQNAVNIGFVKADFAKPDTVCTGATFQLTNTSTPSSFVGSVWSFGDGSSSTDVVPVYAYSIPGTYQVKLVTDFGSCKDSVFKSIVSIPKPTASFTSSNNTSCKPPLNVSFNNTSVGAVTYKWYFGDGDSSVLQNPSHTYTKLGKYTVSLIIINVNGCIDTLTQVNLVNISPPEIIRIDSLPMVGCLPLTITPFPVIQTGIAITSYSWDFGDGGTSTSSTPTHIYNTSGNFDVKLIVSAGVGCADTIIVTNAVKAGTRPTAQFSGSPLDICANTAVVFNDASSGNPITDWYWDFGDGGTTSGVQNPSHMYNDTGRFNIMLVAYNFGCTDTIIKVNYIHVKPPIAKFDTSYNCNQPLIRNFLDSSIGASSWTWDFGDGGSSTLQNPTHTYAASGNYPVALTVSDGSCQHTFTKNIKVLKQQGKLLVSDSFNCRNVRLIFDIVNVEAGSLQKFNWYFEGISQSYVTTSNLPVAKSYSTFGTRFPAVVVTDILQCIDTFFSITPVTIFGPKAIFGSDVKGSCLGGAINFLDSSFTDNTHPIKSWKWSYGDGVNTTYLTGPFSHVYTNPGTYDVMLLVKDSYGCQDSLLKPAYINISQVKAGFIPSDTLLCPSSTGSFTNNSLGTDLTYKWDFGDNTYSAVVEPTHVYNLPGAYMVSLVVFDKNGCRDSIANTIRVFSAKADFILNDSFSTCPPLILNATNKSSNFINFNWDFGDGTSSTVLNPSHIYTYPGNYTIQLTVLNNGGCSDTLRKSIVINGPSGIYGNFPTEACNPGTIKYAVIAQNAIKYVWDFGDGNTIFSSNDTILHTYTIPGNYLIKVILEDGIGCRVAISSMDTVRITGIQTNIKTNIRQLCDSGFIAFSDSTITNDSVSNYLWSFGDGGTSITQNPNHFYAASGLYSIKLIATTPFGCTDTVELIDYVKIAKTPIIKIMGDTIACAPTQLIFSGQLIIPDTSSIKWRWDFDNGNSSNLQFPPLQVYNNTGVYNTQLIASNFDGCSDTATLKTTIYDKPNVDAGVGATICTKQPQTLIPSGADSYVWFPNASLSCLACDTTVANPSVKTTYYVTGTLANGCTNVDSVTVDIKQPFVLTVGNGDTLCYGESVPLNVSGADTYEWIPSKWLNNPVAANPVTRPDSSITYMVVGQDIAKCYKDTGYVSIKVYPLPTVNITNGNFVNLEVGQSVKLNTHISNDVTKLLWSPTLGLSCMTCIDPIVSARENITYTVTATNAGNCSSQDKINIVMICKNANVFIPNTFSPNGDGINDIFYPRGNGLGVIKSCRIFNRWGQIVFLKLDFNANDPSMGWDGKMNGIDMQSDVYVYIIEVFCINNEVQSFKGNVSLLR